MAPLNERLRNAANRVRVNAQPLKDLIPLIQEAADTLDKHDRAMQELTATVRGLREEMSALTRTMKGN